jgi:hypothetical protein
MVSKKKCDVEVLVRGAHEKIIEGLMTLDEVQLEEGLQWSQMNYGKLDVERLIELAIELHQESKKTTQ